MGSEPEKKKNETHGGKQGVIGSFCSLLEIVYVWFLVLFFKAHF